MARKIPLPKNISPNPFDPLGLAPTKAEAAVHSRVSASSVVETETPADDRPTLEVKDGGKSADSTKRQVRPKRSERVGSKKRAARGRNRESFYVTDNLMERVRNAVAYRSGAPDFLDMSRFAENAFERYVRHLEKTSNQGSPFPERPAFMRKMYARGPR